MIISFDNFYSQLRGARYCDEHRWTKLNQEQCLWNIFAFADDGAYYIGSEVPKQPADVWPESLSAVLQ